LFYDAIFNVFRTAPLFYQPHPRRIVKSLQATFPNNIYQEDMAVAVWHSVAEERILKTAGSIVAAGITGAVRVLSGHASNEISWDITKWDAALFVMTGYAALNVLHAFMTHVNCALGEPDAPLALRYDDLFGNTVPVRGSKLGD
jgi:hypothetical protein